MQPGVGNTTRVPLPLAQHLNNLGEFLMNKDSANDIN